MKFEPDHTSASAQQKSYGSDLNQVWVHCRCGDLSFLRGLADSRAMDLGLCAEATMDSIISRDKYITVEEMVRRHDEIT